MSRTVVVVGAGGKVGSEILGYLRGDPRLSLRGICRNEVTAGPLRLLGHQVECGEITDPKDRERLVGDADLVVNCAAASGPPGKARAQDEAIVRAVGEAARGRGLVHLSSVAVYGSCIDLRRNRFEEPRPDDPYGRDKLHLERVLGRSLAKGARLWTLRMGHVYGERQWVSRYVFGFIGGDFRLPFDGRMPSNAIHVHNVAEAVRQLALGSIAPGTYNLADQPGRTWRQIFDWHTDAAGLPPFPALGEAESAEILRHERKQAETPVPRRVAEELVAWSRSVPQSIIAACPSVKVAGQILLANLKWEGLEQLATLRITAANARAVGQRARPPPIPKVGKLVGDGMPGPHLDYPPARDEEDRRRVADWYRRYSQPDAILAEAARIEALAPA